MFLVPLDDRRVWYRYHHLFADVLQARLLDEHPQLVAELHRRASDWFEQHGEGPEAIRHALIGRDFVRAAGLVELAVPAMRQARQEATLRTWFDALPADIYADRPVLTIGWVGARMSSGQLEGVEAKLVEVERWLEPTGDLARSMVVLDQAELARLPAQAAMYRTALSLLAGDVAGTVVHANRALGLTAEDDHLGLGAARALLGLALWTEGDLEPAEARYAESIECFRRAEHHADILGCARALADIQVARGRLGAALRTLEAGLELARDHGPLRGTADMHAGLAEVLRERNDLDAARTHVEASRELGEHLALPQNAYRWRVGLARLLQVDGELADALDLLADAEHLYDTDYSPSIRPVPAVTARMHLVAGDIEAALRWVESRGVTVDDPLSYLREYEHLTLARVLLAQHAAEGDGRVLDDAAALLDRLRTEAEAGGRTGSAVEIRALRALVHHAAGDPSTAIEELDEAIRLAQPEGFVRLFLDEGPPMLALLRLAARTGTAAAAAQRLVAAAAPSPTDRATPSRPGFPGLVDPLSDRELQVLRLLRSELSGPEIARELMVSLNTLRTHTKNIYMKLGVSSRRAAVRRAGELGL
jgi:LuxR family maltose regulon positive regulatory protein